MNDQMPDFEPDPDLSTAPAPKKPRRKPMKRRKSRKIEVFKPAPKRRKRRVVKTKGRRGRPPGALNKPKAQVPLAIVKASPLFTTDVYRVIGSLMALDKVTLARVLELFR
jgi:hypothetical protein